jgi:hypothetical protein
VVFFSGPGSFASISWKVDNSLPSRTSGVSIHDMCADPTSTPRYASSSRSELAKCSTPAFEASYEAMPGAAANAASDDTTST